MKTIDHIARHERPPGLLIVDDEAGVRCLLTAVLAEQGFAVWQAADGSQAVAVYRSQHQFIDLVLLDVVMPGLDGPRTLHALREVHPTVRCCFMSGFLGSYTRQELLDDGALAVFDKPLSMKSLLEEVRHLAGAHHEV